MSHKELDIETSFQGIFKDISLSNPRVDEDIRIYVQSQIRDDRKYSRWPEALKKDIEARSCKGGKGHVCGNGKQAMGLPNLTRN